MIALIQRVSRASVHVDQQLIGAIDTGLLILLGVHGTDTQTEIDWLVNKTALLRVFPDDDGIMNRSLVDVNGDALVVSQFTLYANTTKGNRPSYIDSAPPDIAEPLYEQFIKSLNNRLPSTVMSGSFGAMMDVELVNDGPVTIWLERRAEEYI